MARNWIVVSGPEIFATTRDLGFTRHGFKSTRRVMASKIQPGDLLAFYVTGRKQFAAVCRVTSPVTEERTRIWQSDKKPDEIYPYRCSIEPLALPAEAAWLDAEPFHDRFAWTQRWPRTSWTLAYQGNLHEVPQEDMDILLAAMREATAAPRPA